MYNDVGGGFLISAAFPTYLLKLLFPPGLQVSSNA